jgi:exopolysaccharide biosynthesis polyprenyl glycosylphosphotransferase
VSSNFTAKPAIPSRPSRPFVSPSRLIPGVQTSVGSIPRKKPSSVTIDGRFWDWQDPDRNAEPRAPNIFASLAEILLPGRFSQDSHRRLARQVSADFTSVILVFAAIGQLTVLLQFAISHDSSTLLRFVLLPGSGLGLLLIYAALFVLLGYYEHLYDPETIQSPRQERLVVGKVSFWSAAVMVTVAASFHPHLLPLTALLASSPLNFLTALAWRNQWRRAAGQPEQRENDVRNVLIIGAGKLGRKLAAHIGQDLAHGRIVKGFLDEAAPVYGDVHGRVEDLARIVRADFVDEIILAAPLQRDVARRIIQEARRNHVDVKIVPDLFGFEPESLAFEKFGNIPVLTLREEPLPLFGLFLKRTVDVLFAGVALVLTSPLLAVIALAIKLESPGPVLYRAQRVGFKGRRFFCHKFRTMNVDAEKLKEFLRTHNERQGPFFKIVDDPRITRVGRFLRRYSLDELPQFWNVFQGEMSLVGPRPPPLDDFERYDIGDLQRLDVPPGITGLWQVTARHDPSFERGLALDLKYIESWSLWRDFQILYKTVAVVLHGSGA